MRRPHTTSPTAFRRLAAVRALGAPALLALLAILALSACSQDYRIKPVDLLWPDLNDPYQQTTRAWTRSQAIYSGIDAEFLATATLLSEPWRKAFAQRYAEVYSLPPAEAQAFRMDQLAAMAKHTEVILALSGPKRELTELDFRDSRWRVFILANGDQHAPLEIAPLDEDVWPPAKLEVFFPYWKRWQHFYSLRFDILPPGPATLVMSGPAGRVEFQWPEGGRP